jgi:hypothetical protein
MLGFIIRSRTIRMTLVFVKIKKKIKKKFVLIKTSL